ncbi:GspH/FimT family pseudopilin [Iodobacter ciconiae]|uniref:Type II secretion system protein H n=1 Tax=Iodobacter ciconiae TaxID=2496266 RepID=A0A3S8ZXF9_9NEIS|nr:GspH/FimT family pseudopilin [Iodobacter ciconiae]AZN38138.1 prepilin-type N-terminal cleavage/methylation domain-containing protein [Iodobacter ciconiae]
MNFSLQKHHGFSLIEIMIVLVIFGVLAAIAMPGFQDWVRSAKLRSFAESFQTAVQTARAEAINRNAYVELVLTNSAVGADAARNANAVTVTATGTAWLIRECTTCANINTAATTAETYPFIGGKVLAEGGSNNPPGLNASAGLIRFDGLGRANAAFNLIVADTPALATPADCGLAGAGPVTDPARVCVVLDRGGNARMCLPDAPATQPSSCARS